MALVLLPAFLQVLKNKTIKAIWLTVAQISKYHGLQLWMPRTFLVNSAFEATCNFCTSSTLTYSLLNSVGTENNLGKATAA